MTTSKIKNYRHYRRTDNYHVAMSAMMVVSNIRILIVFSAPTPHIRSISRAESLS